MGLVTAYVEKVTIPPVEIEPRIHRPPDASYETKFASGLKFGDVILEKVMPAEYPDPFAWLWLNTAIEPITGIQLPEQVYKMDMLIAHLSEHGGYPVAFWYVRGAFPRKIEYSPNQTIGGHIPVTQKITIFCDSYAGI